MMPIKNNTSESHTLTHCKRGSEGGSDFEKIQSIKRELVRLGVLGVNAVEQAIRSGVRLDDIESVVKSASELSPSPDPRVIFGRIKSLKDSPDLAHAPWPQEISAVRKLRASDAAHERDKLRRRNLALVSVNASSGDSGDDERDRELEREFGPWLDAMEDDERNEFARSVLSDFLFSRFRRDPQGPTVRLQLLEALERRIGAKHG